MYQKKLKRKEQKMTCKKCKNKKATYFYTESDGERNALCAECSALVIRNGYTQPDLSDISTDAYTPTLDLSEYERYFSSFPVFFDDGRMKNTKCRVCGTDSTYLKKNRRLGCSECYSAFSQYLPASFSQGATRLPRAHRARLENVRLIKEMKEKMKTAVAAEDFESAAKLRDRIKLLEADAV